MKRYTVKWGVDSKVVLAESAQDAWAEFARGNDVATRHPHMHAPEIKEVELPKLSSPPPSVPPIATSTLKTGEK
jgi:hypothetical protein